MRCVVDGSWRRYGDAVLAGSPLRLFRTTAAGTAVTARIERGEDVTDSRLVRRLLDAGAIHPVAEPGRRPTLTPADVTIVIPRYRRGTAPRDDAPGAPSSRTSPPIRLITIDDGSQPPIAGATVRLDRNQGPAAARNAARPTIRTALVAFVDDDVEARDGHASWVEPLLWHFDDPRTGLVAPRITGETGSPLDLGAEPGRIRSGTRISYVPGAAIVVRREALDAIGWFDETLRFGEDVDLVWRLDDAGWACRYDPSVSVWHRPRPTLRARLRQHRGYGTSAAPLALRHPHALSPVQVNGWTALAWTVAGLGHPVGGASIAVGSAAALHRKLPALPHLTTFSLALRGHLHAAPQFAAAVRRTWWPIVALGALVSRRCRWLLLGALAASPRSAPTDVAYGWGLWSGMWRHRTVAPIVPRLRPWPPRDRPSSVPERPPLRSRR